MKREKQCTVSFRKPAKASARVGTVSSGQFGGQGALKHGDYTQTCSGSSETSVASEGGWLLSGRGCC